MCVMFVLCLFAHEDVFEIHDKYDNGVHRNAEMLWNPKESALAIFNECDVKLIEPTPQLHTIFQYNYLT